MHMSRYPSKLYLAFGFLSIHMWGRLPGSIQLSLSAILARFYRTGLSRLLIRPYCWWQYGDPNYHNKFRPGSGGDRYISFQDFFTRDFSTPLAIKSSSVWPCEGYLCESGKVSALSTVNVKGERRTVQTIFGIHDNEMSKESFFSNVFLHNNNYHHIHSPVSGTITRIERIPGKLLLLRPWAYKSAPSLPALTNERVNIDITDRSGKCWLLSVVGGPLVATIKMVTGVVVGAHVTVGQKISSFEMGSTCCLVSPHPPNANVGDIVKIGSPI
jgi:phosphatidylserine decarboxylase